MESGPTKNISKKSREEATSEERLAAYKELLPSGTSLQQQQQPQHNSCHEEEQEPVQPCQPKHT
ncbi:hypothetical protein E2C01_025163 [Portunus trituberculatus]|uniref:Uncharacterized protein n=1 Tax=Portunus trituberculatus TaxID=210409 RepID=A0A5B7EH42_PORTR|nr:hypothetical protein [Portunus trituberculatus]